MDILNMLFYYFMTMIIFFLVYIRHLLLPIINFNAKIMPNNKSTHIDTEHLILEKDLKNPPGYKNPYKLIITK